VELLTGTPERVLAVYAHPDDPDVACAGTLARWSDEGAEVHVLICTDGGKGTMDPGTSTEELVQRRAAEARAACDITGITGLHTLGRRDGELVDDGELVGAIVGYVRRIRPEVVLCPDPTAFIFGEDYLNHRDHRVVGTCVLDSLAPASALPLYFPDQGPPHQASVAYLTGTLEPGVWVDISDTVETKVAAVACHASQFPEGPGWARQVVLERASAEGARVGVAYAEAFRRLRLNG
jgi:LmbE family N-acetylglucosaminyl deacetylase